jgi:NAD(P)-dependent dehydrogenase (short-subunit alcohol dehydrogenase family)
MNMQLEGKVALITGAARGIGAAIASAFSHQGASVAIADIDGTEAARTATGIPGSLALEADVRDPAAVASMVDRTLVHFGRLDVLVNNAGIGHTKLFLETTLEEWEQVLGVNLTGCFLAAQAAARAMVRQGGGTIVSLGSISGQRGGVRRAAYGASKAGVMQLTRVLAVELAPYPRARLSRPGAHRGPVAEWLARCQGTLHCAISPRFAGRIALLPQGGNQTLSNSQSCLRLSKHIIEGGTWPSGGTNSSPRSLRYVRPLSEVTRQDTPEACATIDRRVTFDRAV